MNLLLDTNVVSDIARHDSDRRVRQWLDSHKEDQVFLSAVTIAEICQGIAFLPTGRRRAGYETWYRELRGRYHGRIFPISEDVADCWGQLSGTMRAKGKAMPVMDGFIAATAIVHNCVVATRNIRHFQNFDIDVLDPWRVAS